MGKVISTLSALVQESQIFTSNLSTVQEEGTRNQFLHERLQINLLCSQAVKFMSKSNHTTAINKTAGSESGPPYCSYHHVPTTSHKPDLVTIDSVVKNTNNHIRGSRGLDLIVDTLKYTHVPHTHKLKARSKKKITIKTLLSKNW